MSDEVPIKELKIEVNRNREIEELIAEKEQLKIENQEKDNRISELETDLTTISEMEFKKRCDKYGLSGLSPDNQEDIKKLVEKEMADIGNMRGLTSDQIYGEQKVNVDNEYNSIPDMISDLNRKANFSDNAVEKATSEAILKELNKVAVKDVRSGQREPFSMDIDPAELKKLRDETKQDIARKRGLIK